MSDQVSILSVNPFTSISVAVVRARQLRFLSNSIRLKKTITLGGVTNGRSKLMRTEVAHVFTSEEIQITGCEGEHISDPSVELGTFKENEAAIGPILCEEWDIRPDEERVVFVHIYVTYAIGKAGAGDEWTRVVHRDLGLRSQTVERAEDGHDGSKTEQVLPGFGCFIWLLRAQGITHQAYQA